MKDLLELVQKFIDGFTQILKPPFVPTFGLPGGKHAASASSATPGVSNESGFVFFEFASGDQSTQRKGS